MAKVNIRVDYDNGTYTELSGGHDIPDWLGKEILYAIGTKGEPTPKQQDVANHNKRWRKNIVAAVKYKRWIK